MKHLLLIFLVGMFLSSCKDQKTTVAVETTVAKDQEEVTTLIRNVLVWSHSKNGIDLTPPKVIKNDTVFKSFDTVQLSKNLVIFDKAGFFTKGFINNYENIIKTLDKKLKNGEYGEWYGGELPPFRFDNDIDPWCNCQDNSAWDEVETEVIQLDDKKGELYWKFGGQQLKEDASWKEFSYKFKVAKQNGKWKIDWMEGFDYETSTKVMICKMRDFSFVEMEKPCVPFRRRRNLIISTI